MQGHSTYWDMSKSAIKTLKAASDWLTGFLTEGPAGLFRFLILAHSLSASSLQTSLECPQLTLVHFKSWMALTLIIWATKGRSRTVWRTYWTVCTICWTVTANYRSTALLFSLLESFTWKFDSMQSFFNYDQIIYGPAWLHPAYEVLVIDKRDS